MKLATENYEFDTLIFWTWSKIKSKLNTVVVHAPDCKALINEKKIN